jgi:hypothetical protein
MRVYEEYLEGTDLYICKACKMQLTSVSELLSKAFRGSSGKAYLFNDVQNVDFGELEEKQMYTGIHQVVDIICRGCQKVLGWKYIVAYNPSERYKEGKFILEKEYILKELREM